MDVTLLKQPYEVSFTGNPMPYCFAIAPFGFIEKKQNIRLQVRIYIEHSFASEIFSEIKSQDLYPDSNGNVLLDVQSILAPYLDFFTPRPSLNIAVEAADQRKRYKISYLLIVNNVPQGTSSDSPVLYAIKGGMAIEQWHYSNFFTGVIIGNKAPLAFIAKGEKAFTDDLRFLYWLYPNDDQAAQTITYTILLDDSTTVVHALPDTITCGKWGICVIPASLNSAGLSGLIPAGKYAVSMSISIVTAGIRIYTSPDFELWTSGADTYVRTVAPHDVVEHDVQINIGYTLNGVAAPALTITIPAGQSQILLPAASAYSSADFKIRYVSSLPYLIPIVDTVSGLPVTSDVTITISIYDRFGTVLGTATDTMLTGQWELEFDYYAGDHATITAVAGGTPPVLVYTGITGVVANGRAAQTIVDSFAYQFDYRNFYKTELLLYRNSIGGLETIRMRGQIDMNADFGAQQALRIEPLAYFKNLNLVAQITAENTEETFKYTGDTGFISKEATIKLRDFFLSTERYQLTDSKLIPITSSAKNIKFYGNKDNLVAVAIEWQHAFVNRFFTPRGIMPAAGACPAMESFNVRQLDKRTLQVMYSMQSPYDRLEIKIAITNPLSEIDYIYTFSYTGNAGTIILPFTNPATTTPVNIWVRGRTVCNDNATPVDYGPGSVVELPVHGNSLPVVTDDVYNINEGYSDYTALSGSVLDNDYDPDNDPIQVVAAAGVTNAGGWYTINAAGNVTYKPPSSLWFGVDYFIYNVREVGGTVTVPGKVTINVGQASVNVYAKLIVGVLNNGYGTIYVNFYKDYACTISVDVTQFHLTMNMRDLYEHYRRQGNVIIDMLDTATNNYVVFPTGTSVVVYTGLIYTDRNQIFWHECYRHTVTIQPGSGYTAV